MLFYLVQSFVFLPGSRLRCFPSKSRRDNCICVWIKIYNNTQIYLSCEIFYILSNGSSTFKQCSVFIYNLLKILDSTIIVLELGFCVYYYIEQGVDLI